jgi:hypothetical protein
MNKRNTFFSALICASLPTVSFGEVVTSLTIQDVGSGGTGDYRSTPDFLAGGFGFNNGFATRAFTVLFDTCNTLDYVNQTTGRTSCPSYIGITTNTAHAYGTFSGGFPFANQPFLPWTSGPITADISIVGGDPVLTIASNLTAFPWGGWFANSQNFVLHPTPTLIQTPGFECNQYPFIPMSVVWVNRIGESDNYNYAIQWTHCITEAEDPSYDYVGQLAGWYLEGIMTVQDTITPTVTSAIANGASSASNVDLIVTFSEPMNPATVTTGSFLVYPTASGAGASECVSIIASNNNKTFTCNAPVTGFTANPDGVTPTPFTLRLTTTITDDSTSPAANALTLTDRTFNMLGPDTLGPSFVSSNPTNTATGIATNATISVTFADAYSTAAITATAISLSEGGNTLNTTFSSSDNLTYSFTPTTPLKNNTLYTLFVDSTIAQDPSGNLLTGGNQAITFTTETASTLTDAGATATIPGASAASLVYITYVSAAEAQTIAGVTTVSDRIRLDNNFIDYVVNNVTGSVTVTLDFPVPISVTDPVTGVVTNKDIFKAVNGEFVKLTEGTGNNEYTLVDADTITITITDNGPLDNDETTTGVIHDPIGTGTDLGPKPVPGALSGCSISGNTEKLQDHAEWLLLATLLAWMGFMARRNKQA